MSFVTYGIQPEFAPDVGVALGVQGAAVLSELAQGGKVGFGEVGGGPASVRAQFDQAAFQHGT